ncbi:MAG: ABC-type transport auxiliary lipoprotein family protein [Steroidobacteraceae bacterium]
MKSLGLAFAVLLLAGCATRPQDHFYVVNPLPAAVAAPSQFDRQVTVRVAIPSLFDRGEMVLTAPNGVSVMDHERWAAPLADMISSALSQDIERRRSDVVVLPKSADKAGIPLVRISVEIDQISARLTDHLSIETHWRVTDARTGKETLGRDAFVSPQQPQSYAEIAAAFSACIALLADRLAGEIPSG